MEKNGKIVLKNLEIQGKGPNDTNGWTAVRDSVDKYLRMANSVIEECQEIACPDSLDPNSQEYRRSDRRADSGVSFGIGDRPSTSSSRRSRSNSTTTNNKPLPASPPMAQAPQQAPLSPRKKGTTLEKIARELRNLRSRSDPHKGATVTLDGNEKAKSIKKMKSTSSIRDISRSSSSNYTKHTRMGSGGSGSKARTFDIDDEKRQQLIREAQRQKENNRVLGPPVAAARAAHELP